MFLRLRWEFPVTDQDLDLLAIKLSSAADSGAIRPRLLTHDCGKPALPLKPTIAAAQDDMPLQLFMHGPSQDVPTNQFALPLC